MSQTGPVWSIYINGLYDVTLGKLGSLSLAIPIEVYSNFDVLTGVRISAICSSDRDGTLTKLLYIIKCLGRRRWSPFTHVSGCVQT